MKVAGGSIGGVPFYGAVGSISGADVTALLAATAGLVRTIAGIGAGAIGLGVAIVGALAYLKSLPVPKIPLDSTITSVTSKNRRFLGIAIDSEIEFNCDEDKIIAPLSIVNRLWTDVHVFRPSELTVELIDGGIYKNINLDKHGYFEPKLSMRFLTITGVQTVKPTIHDMDFSIRSATITEVEQLRDNLTQAMNTNLNSMINIVGKSTLSQYFNLSQFQIGP
jgi:hypothetical protein